MNEYSHITQSFLISSLTSVYFAWKWFLKQSQKQEKNDDDRELLKNIEIIRLAFLKFGPKEGPEVRKWTVLVYKKGTVQFLDRTDPSV